MITVVARFGRAARIFGLNRGRDDREIEHFLFLIGIGRHLDEVEGPDKRAFLNEFLFGEALHFGPGNSDLAEGARPASSLHTLIGFA